MTATHISRDDLVGRQRYWDEVASNYDQVFPATLVGQIQRAAIWRELDTVFTKGQRVLELNCGTGIDAVHLAQRGIHVLGCDVSSRMVELAQQRARCAGVEDHVQFKVLPTEDIATLCGSSTFDGAFSNFSGLNCVHDLHATALALGELLAPGACALVCMVGEYAPWEFIREVARNPTRAAFKPRVQRMRSSGVVEVRIPTVRQIARDFGPMFHLKSWKGIGIAVPPSSMNSFAEAFPRTIEALARIDRWIAECPGLRSLGDCVLLQFERNPAARAGR